MDRKEMNLLEKILAMFSRIPRLRMGAIQQPVDLIDYVNAVHASTYQKITGKALTIRNLDAFIKKQDKDISSDGFSLARRLARGY